MKQFLILMVFGSFLAFPGSAIGQTSPNPQQTGKVKMTSAELQSLMETIMKAKRARYHKKRRIPYPVYRQPGQAQTNPATVPNQGIRTEKQDNTALNTRIAKLENLLRTLNSRVQQSEVNNKQQLEQLRISLTRELDYLRRQPINPTDAPAPPKVAETAGASNFPKETIIYQPATEQPNPTNPTSPIVINNNVTEDTPRNNDAAQLAIISRQLQELMDKMDQTKTPTPTSQSPTIVYPSNTTANPADYDELRRRIAYLENALNNKPAPSGNTEVIVKEIPVIKEVQVIKEVPVYTTNPVVSETGYGERRNVYFLNASSDLLQDAKITLEDVVNLMRSNYKLDLIIKGFASDKGSSLYNKSLSQSRSESVRNYIMQQGIEGNRITTEHHGIDHGANDPQLARRAELILIVKRKP